MVDLTTVVAVVDDGGGRVRVMLPDDGVVC
jgi:hypothetical protein